ncbi:MAG: restriction endonuclease [Sciscionella sp.]|nr:restriction endonuclease [Sciscionella sp.]
MDLTVSYRTALPAALLARYELRETRNAAAILAATAPTESAELVEVLTDFELRAEDLVDPGGNESRLASRLNRAFRDRGWREGKVDTKITSELVIKAHRPAGETRDQVRTSSVFNEGYKVDNVKGRVALDIEWNAKDGNLDRDIGAYRALYDAGIIDGAVLITRTHDDLRSLAQRLALAAGHSTESARRRLSTTTTTNLSKLEPRMTRGDAGGCPLLAVAISARCADPVWKSSAAVSGSAVWPLDPDRLL